jgi:hypothetical protein
MTATLGIPLALGLLALAAAPIIAHLVRRRPTIRRAFGAMLLLRRMQRRLRRRRRIHDRWLLALRMLIVALVVLAAAHPELRWPGAVPEFGGTGAVVVVIDNSLSMDLQGAGPGGGTLLSQARSQAAELLRSLPADTLVAAVTVGGSAVRLTPALTVSRAGVIASIADVRQTQAATDLVGGIREARRLLGGTGGEVVVFTDEAGPSTVRSALPEIDLLTQQGGALVPWPIRAEVAANVAVIDARYGSGPEGGTVRVMVANFGPDDVEVPCTVTLPDGTAITAFIDVEAGETAEEHFTVPRVTEGGVGLATIDDGTLEADDEFAFHLPTVGASRVLVLDGDPGLTPVASEVYFLERALAPWGGSAALHGGVLPEVTASTGLAELDPDEHRLVFLANVADPAPLANYLVDFVKRGGGVVIGLGDNVTAERYNGVLAQLLPSPLRRPRDLVGPSEAGVATLLPDTSLALFAPFARGGRSAFGRIRWRRLFTLEPFDPSEKVRTLLAIEGGIPLVVERSVGDGRVILFTGTFDAAWGNLPLQAAYMPWVQSMVRYLGGRSAGAGENREARVEDIVEITLPVAVPEVLVVGPRGTVPSETTANGIRFRPDRAGAYQVETPGAPPLARVAVNVDPGESDVRPGPSLAETAAEVDPDRFLHRVSLLPVFLWTVLGLALLLGVVARWPKRVAEVVDEPQQVRHAG